MLAYDYPILGLFWTFLWVFLWVAWLFVLFQVIFDVFRSHDMGGWGKALWMIFVVLVPFLGVFVYVVTQNDAMTRRNLERAKAQRAQMDEYLRTTASSGGAAAEIERAKQLLDSGAIDQAEFQTLKQRALASSS